jgi:hypothetical protein
VKIPRGVLFGLIVGLAVYAQLLIAAVRQAPPRAVLFASFTPATAGDAPYCHGPAIVSERSIWMTCYVGERDVALVQLDPSAHRTVRSARLGRDVFLSGFARGPRGEILLLARDLQGTKVGRLVSRDVEWIGVVRDADVRAFGAVGDRVEVVHVDGTIEVFAGSGSSIRAPVLPRKPDHRTRIETARLEEGRWVFFVSLVPETTLPPLEIPIVRIREGEADGVEIQQIPWTAAKGPITVEHAFTTILDTSVGGVLPRRPSVRASLGRRARRGSSARCRRRARPAISSTTTRSKKAARCVPSCAAGNPTRPPVGS